MNTKDLTIGLADFGHSCINWNPNTIHEPKLGTEGFLCPELCNTSALCSPKVENFQIIVPLFHQTKLKNHIFLKSSWKLFSFCYQNQSLIETWIFVNLFKNFFSIFINFFKDLIKKKKIYINSKHLLFLNLFFTESLNCLKKNFNWLETKKNFYLNFRDVKMFFLFLLIEKFYVFKK